MRKFLVLFTLCAVAFAACEGGNDEAAPTIELTSSEVIEFGAEGGEQDITFVILNERGSSVNVSERAAWLSAELQDDKVVVKADANPTTNAREAVVTLQYFKAAVKVTVKQAAAAPIDYDVEFKAKRFEGIYFGTDYSSVPNYYVIISDIGAASDGTPKANGSYYFFDIYSKVVAKDDVVTLPKGTYTFDADDTLANGTFSDAGSFYAKMNAEGKYEASANYKSATITVEDNKFEAVIEFTNGQKHHVVFEGELIVDIGYIRSTFTEDYEFAIDGATITAEYCGNDNSMNKHNWYIEAIYGEELFIVDILSESNTSCFGIYSQIVGGGAEDYVNKFVPGVVGSDGLVGTWYATLTNGVIKGDRLAPMVSGFIQIEDKGNGQVSINYSCKDDAGNKITGYVAGSFTTK